MIKYYIGLSIISILVLAAIVYGFLEVGTPWNVRKEKSDETRVADLGSIKSSVDSFYGVYLFLPQSLDSMKQYEDHYSSLSDLKDPVSGEPYEYKKVTNTTYELCANFSAPSKKDSSDSIYDYPRSDSTFDHPKGRHCFNVEVPQTYLKERQDYDKRYDLRVVFSTDANKEQKVAQTFQVDKDNRVKIIDVELVSGINPTSGLVTLRKVVTKDNLEAGELLGSVDLYVDAGGSIRSFVISFDSPINLVAGEEYALIFELANDNATAYEIIGYEGNHNEREKAYLYTWKSYEQRNEEFVWTEIPGVRLDYKLRLADPE